MKIGVMSDTHGSLTYFEKALDVLSDCDVLIHGGDILYHGPRNDIPEGYNPKGLISKINSEKRTKNGKYYYNTCRFIIILLKLFF